MILNYNLLVKSHRTISGIYVKRILNVMKAGYKLQPRETLNNRHIKQQL